MVADHQNKPDIAASKGREWIDQQGISLLIAGAKNEIFRAAADAQKICDYLNEQAITPDLAQPLPAPEALPIVPRSVRGMRP